MRRIKLLAWALIIFLNPIVASAQTQAYVKIIFTHPGADYFKFYLDKDIQLSINSPGQLVKNTDGTYTYTSLAFTATSDPVPFNVSAAKIGGGESAKSNTITVPLSQVTSSSTTTTTKTTTTTTTSTTTTTKTTTTTSTTTTTLPKVPKLKCVPIAYTAYPCNNTDQCFVCAKTTEVQ